MERDPGAPPRDPGGRWAPPSPAPQPPPLPAPGPDLTLTAIVVGYNHAHCLGRCLDSVVGSRGLAALEVIYVDNASSDSSVAATSVHAGRIRTVVNPANVGFAAAVNQGLRLATSRYVALVNPDATVGPDLLRALCDVLRAHPGVGLAAPLLLDEEGQPQVSLSPYPTLLALAGRWLGRRVRPDRAWLVGALVVAERALLEDVGGLDEGYFVYGEDMELSRRVQGRGRSIRVEPGLHATHTGNPRFDPDRLVRIYGAYMRFAARHLGLERLPLGALLTSLYLLRGGLAGVGPGELADGLERIWSRGRDRPPAKARPAGGAR
jgi:N-acetylglucosaminyl-diphospho-decaprenol L-rhamnosyltransferase